MEIFMYEHNKIRFLHWTKILKKRIRLDSFKANCSNSFATTSATNSQSFVLANYSDFQTLLKISHQICINIKVFSPYFSECAPSRKLYIYLYSKKVHGLHLRKIGNWNLGNNVIKFLSCVDALCFLVPKKILSSQPTSVTQRQH